MHTYRIMVKVDGEPHNTVLQTVPIEHPPTHMVYMLNVAAKELNLWDLEYYYVRLD